MQCITLYLLNRTIENVYNALISNIYNKNLVPSLMAVGFSQTRLCIGGRGAD